VTERNVHLVFYGGGVIGVYDNEDAANRVAKARNDYADRNQSGKRRAVNAYVQTTSFRPSRTRSTSVEGPTVIWNRFDIAEAYAVLEWDWHDGGWLRERPRTCGAVRHAASSVRPPRYSFTRIGFKSRPNLSFETLTENGKAIYRHGERKFGLAKWNIEPLTR